MHDVIGDDDASQDEHPSKFKIREQKALSQRKHACILVCVHGRENEREDVRVRSALKDNAMVGGRAKHEIVRRNQASYQVRSINLDVSVNRYRY